MKRFAFSGHTKNKKSEKIVNVSIFKIIICKIVKNYTPLYYNNIMA